MEHKPLDRNRYWEGPFGPPRIGAEARFIADLGRAEHAIQAAALQALSRTPCPASALNLAVEVLDELADCGLVISGLDLRRRERTFRLSALGHLIATGLASP